MVGEKRGRVICDGTNGRGTRGERTWGGVAVAENADLERINVEKSVHVWHLRRESQFSTTLATCSTATSF